MQEPKPEPKPIEPMRCTCPRRRSASWRTGRRSGGLLSEAREWMRLAVELQTGLADLEASESLRRGT